MNFLDLPTEVRSRIIRLLLTRPCPVDILFESRRKEHVDIQDACFATNNTAVECCGYLECLQGLRGPGRMGMPYKSRWTCVGPLFSIELLRVCKQIYLEAVNILYTGNKFILTSATLEEMPLSRTNLFRIRSLQLNALHLRLGGSLDNYQRMMKSLQLNSSVHLTVTVISDNQALLHGFASSLLSMAPLKSCSLSLGSYPKAQALGIKLIGQQTNRLFPRYNDLPREIRYQILGYTDLVQNYQITDGKLYFGTQCCKHCCETLFPCCCNTTPHERQRIVAGSRFSDQCRCKSDPRALLKVSSGFRTEALEVMFARPSRFLFGGQIKHHLVFLRTIKPHLPKLRRIFLRISIIDLEMWEIEEDLFWEEFVECLVSHCTLPLLSITVLAFYFYSDDPYENLPPSEEGWRHHQNFYRSFVPGFRRLIDNGLMELNFQFLDELNSWTDEYTKLVMDRTP